MPGTGLLPGDPAKKIVRAPASDHHVVRAALSVLKGEADLVPVAPRRLNQFETPLCWAFSAVTVLYIRRQTKGTPESLMSPLFFAQVVCAMQRGLTYPSGQMPPLIATGADLDTADSIFGKWGASPFIGNGVTDVPQNTDKLGRPILPELDENTVQAAQSRLFTGPDDITPDGNIGDTAAACLEAGIPIWIGGPVDGPALSALQIGETEKAAPNGDGHARALAGYKTVPVNGTKYRLFHIINSWGSDWCEDGCSWAEEEVLQCLWQALPFEVT